MDRVVGDAVRCRVLLLSGHRVRLWAFPAHHQQLELLAGIARPLLALPPLSSLAPLPFQPPPGLIHSTLLLASCAAGRRRAQPQSAAVGQRAHARRLAGTRVCTAQRRCGVCGAAGGMEKGGVSGTEGGGVSGAEGGGVSGACVACFAGFAGVLCAPCLAL